MADGLMRETIPQGGYNEPLRIVLYQAREPCSDLGGFTRLLSTPGGIHITIYTYHYHYTHTYMIEYIYT